MDINNVVIAGRITKDIDLRYTPAGAAVARFTVAVNRNYKKADGTREADFIQVQAWKGAAETIANHFSKGDEIGLTGRWQTGSYEGQDGKRVYTNDLVVDQFSFGQKANGNRTTGQNNNAPSTRIEQDPFNNGSGPIEVGDDDLPF